MATQTGQVTQSIPLARGQRLSLEKTVIMGILNVTPDSFSDGSHYDSVEPAVAHAQQMIAEGAAIIDIGGESSRPGADPVDAKTEIGRVVPVIEAIRKQSDIPISIDTYKAQTAKTALDAGADMINDISALRFDSEMVNLVAERNVPIVLMHMLGEPRTMQQNPHYDDCIVSINAFFAERIAFAESHGIDRCKIILDPGIGFGKRLVDNLQILARCNEFLIHNCPVLVGGSRKSFIGVIDNSAGPEQRLGGSIAVAVIAVLHGARIIRTHDVRETLQAIRLVEQMQKQ